MFKSSNNDDYDCPVFAKSGRCGEQDALEVMEEFKNFYESKLNEIDLQGGGDCLQLKLKIQRRWIDDLTEQTQMMARIVKELEDEATNRVRMLEDKLKQTSKSAYEKVFYLENDMKNLLEFIRRVRDDKKWSIDGLQFYDVSYKDLFGKERTEFDDGKHKNLVPTRYQDAPKKKESSPEIQVDDSIDENKNKVCEDVFQELKRKSEEYEALRQSMLDMRCALTEEVACKHDMISALKKDIQQLEERCVQADKQTAFKDDIIKELRKEIKQTKQQNKEKEEALTRKLEDYQKMLKNMRPCVNVSSVSTDTDKTASKKREKDLEDEISKRQREVDALKCQCDLLQKALESSQGRADNLQKAESRYGTKGEMKKLRQQNRYYEHVIDCFKHEMAVMSEQLRNLQEILNLSNRSCKEENGQLQNAVVGLQKLSQKLQNQLVDTEKKALIENQMNQLKDAKIDELQLIIGQKNADLNLHDEAINEMKTKLENALLENHELQNTIASLNSTMMQLKCNIECRNLEKSGRNTIEREKKNKKLDKLQADYRDQCEMIKSMQRELQKVKDKSKEKVKQLKRQNEELKEKLATSELTNQQLAKQVNDIKQHATHLSQSDCSREHELAKSKQIILELRQTLIELNESLAESELHSMALAEEYHKSLSDDQEQNDIYFCCRLEIALYKKLAENFKDAVIELRRRLSEVEARNRAINDELRCKEMRISDLQKRTEAIHDLRNQLAELEARNRSLDEEVRNKDQKVNEVQKKATKKERENCQCIQELTEKLKNSQDEERRLCQCVQELTEKWKKSQQEERRLCHCVEDLTEKLKESQEEERRLSNFIDNLKSEVQRKIEDRNEERQAVVNYCECNDMTSTQEDICQLKVEIKNMIQNQLALNNENDKLLKEVTALQDKIGTLEEKNCTLKQKLTKIHTENQNLKDTNKCLMRERETFCQTIRNLEIELADAKNNRDDVCAESRHVVNNVKAWLEEQKRINDKVKKKTQCYCETIEKLKQENETLLRERPQAASPYKTRYEKPYRPCTPLDCPELWLLGSQGTGSLLDSPRDSPISCTCSVEEWYSPNYRDEDETEEQAEDFLTTLEAVTQEIRDNNRKWNCNCKCQEFVVSRDKK